MNSVRHTILGAFFFSILFVLGVVTIGLGDFQALANTTPVSVYFPEVDGLRVGDPVTVYGVTSGSVREISFTGHDSVEQRLLVELTMTGRADFRENYSVTIRDQTFLGGKRVEVELGEGPEIPAGPPLRGETPGGPFEAFGQVLHDNDDNLQRITANLSEILTALSKKESSLMDYLLDTESHGDLKATIHSARTIADKVNDGDGTLSRLVNRGEVHDKMETFLDSGSNLMTTAVDGGGSLSRLLKDESLYTNFDGAMVSARNVLTRVDRGEGLFGKLSSTESDPVFDDARQVIADLRTISQRLARGEGAIGKLVMDDQTAEQMNQIVANFAQISTDVRELVQNVRQGSGALGYLLADGEARRKLENIVDQLASALEDAREAAPVSSVASFLFGNL